MATPQDAAALADAVGASLEHLRPWMPWATPEAATAAFQENRLRGQQWGPEEYGYLMVDADDRIVGGCGLHRRIGPGGIEIGYWVDAGHVRRGYATAAAAALTAAAFALSGIERVEIHCDEANVASAGVPRRLRYRLDRIDDHPVGAPGETGRQMVWVTTRAERARPDGATMAP